MEPTKLAIAVDVSRNTKIGLTAATYAARASCPQDCALYDSCYAKFGKVGMVTARLARAAESQRATALQVAKAEAAAIRELKSGLPLRLHVVGDCRTNQAAEIVSKAAEEYMTRKRTNVWTYTHAHRKVKRASWGKVSVLASCETLGQAGQAMHNHYAAAVVVASHPQDGKAYVDKVTGIRVIPCVAQVREGVTCADCRLCWNDKDLLARKSVIAFEAHGVKRHSLLKVLDQ